MSNCENIEQLEIKQEFDYFSAVKSECERKVSEFHFDFKEQERNFAMNNENKFEASENPMFNIEASFDVSSVPAYQSQPDDDYSKLEFGNPVSNQDFSNNQPQNAFENLEEQKQDFAITETANGNDKKIYCECFSTCVKTEHQSAFEEVRKDVTEPEYSSPIKSQASLKTTNNSEKKLNENLESLDTNSRPALDDEIKDDKFDIKSDNDDQNHGESSISKFEVTEQEIKENEVTQSTFSLPIQVKSSTSLKKSHESVKFENQNQEITSKSSTMDILINSAITASKVSFKEQESTVISQESILNKASEPTAVADIKKIETISTEAAHEPIQSYYQNQEQFASDLGQEKSSVMDISRSIEKTLSFVSFKEPKISDESLIQKEATDDLMNVKSLKSDSQLESSIAVENIKSVSSVVDEEKIANESVVSENAHDLTVASQEKLQKAPIVEEILGATIEASNQSINNENENPEESNYADLIEAKSAIIDNNENQFIYAENLNHTESGSVELIKASSTIFEDQNHQIDKDNINLQQSSSVALTETVIEDQNQLIDNEILNQAESSFAGLNEAKFTVFEDQNPKIISENLNKEESSSVALIDTKSAIIENESQLIDENFLNSQKTTSDELIQTKSNVSMKNVSHHSITDSKSAQNLSISASKASMKRQSVITNVKEELTETEEIPEAKSSFVGLIKTKSAVFVENPSQHAISNKTESETEEIASQNEEIFDTSFNSSTDAEFKKILDEIQNEEALAADLTSKNTKDDLESIERNEIVATSKSRVTFKDAKNSQHIFDKMEEELSKTESISDSLKCQSSMSDDISKGSEHSTEEAVYKEISRESLVTDLESFTAEALSKDISNEFLVSDSESRTNDTIVDNISNEMKLAENSTEETSDQIEENYQPFAISYCSNESKLSTIEVEIINSITKLETDLDGLENNDELTVTASKSHVNFVSEKSLDDEDVERTESTCTLTAENVDEPKQICQCFSSAFVIGTQNEGTEKSVSTVDVSDSKIGRSATSMKQSLKKLEALEDLSQFAVGNVNVYNLKTVPSVISRHTRPEKSETSLASSSNATKFELLSDVVIEDLNDDGFLDLPKVPSSALSEASSSAWIDENISFAPDNRKPIIKIVKPAETSSAEPVGINLASPQLQTVATAENIDNNQIDECINSVKKHGTYCRCKTFFQRLSKRLSS